MSDQVQSTCDRCHKAQMVSRSAFMAGWTVHCNSCTDALHAEALQAEALKEAEDRGFERGLQQGLCEGERTGYRDGYEAGRDAGIAAAEKAKGLRNDW